MLNAGYECSAKCFHICRFQWHSLSYYRDSSYSLLTFFANVLLPRTICAEASHTWCWCLVRMVLYAKYSAIYCLDKRRLLLRKMLYFTLKKIGLSGLGNNTKTRNSETLQSNDWFGFKYVQALISQLKEKTNLLSLLSSRIRC